MAPETPPTWDDSRFAEQVAALCRGLERVESWLFVRPDMVGAVTTLFVDEAGQVSLANAVAVASLARNLVLVGDPQQLAQPSKGSHPDGAGASAMEHGSFGCG